MVVTLFPATLEIGVPQERVGTPLICTVHAPQSCRPQPNLVPVKLNVSRSTQSNGICGETSTLCRFPLRVNSMDGIGSSSVPPVYNREFWGQTPNSQHFFE